MPLGLFARTWLVLGLGALFHGSVFIDFRSPILVEQVIGQDVDQILSEEHSLGERHERPAPLVSLAALHAFELPEELVDVEALHALSARSHQSRCQDGVGVANFTGQPEDEPREPGCDLVEGGGGVVQVATDLLPKSAQQGQRLFARILDARTRIFQHFPESGAYPE